MKNWYAPGEVKVHQMSDEEKATVCEEEAESVGNQSWQSGFRRALYRCSPIAAIYVEKEVTGKWK